MLKDNQRVREAMPLFEHSLSSLNTNIIKRVQDAARGTISLTINADFVDTSRIVKAFAFSCFNDAILQITTERRRKVRQVKADQINAHSN